MDSCASHHRTTHSVCHVLVCVLYLLLLYIYILLWTPFMPAFHGALGTHKDQELPCLCTVAVPSYGTASTRTVATQTRALRHTTLSQVRIGPKQIICVMEPLCVFCPYLCPYLKRHSRSKLLRSCMCVQHPKAVI